VEPVKGRGHYAPDAMLCEQELKVKGSKDRKGKKVNKRNRREQSISLEPKDHDFRDLKAGREAEKGAWSGQERSRKGTKTVGRVRKKQFEAALGGD